VSGLPPRSARVFGSLEKVLWVAGTICVLAWGAARLGGNWLAARDVEAFTAAGQATPTARPDMSQWSPQRVKAWEDAQKRDSGPLLAVLRIPSISLEVPVLNGTDDWTLNRAVGHIDDTALPGAGNMGIAGHRDGFFRGLKDVKVGDALTLETKTGTLRYRVDHIWIVNPEDVWVIDPTPAPAVTLVTCYPFYFVGSAPQRYIVRAVATPVSPRGARP
jgi:sortase A